MSSTFQSLGLSIPLLSVLGELGFEAPTQIQRESIPVLLAGKDLIGQSTTGSGKTAAFTLPILQNLDVARVEVTALVLCPTRELAAQVAREIRKLGRKLPGLQVRTIAGGEPIRTQTAAIGRGVHILVGTPGRVLDHLGRGHLDLSALRTLVLDEGDRMLEMGFQADIEKILASAPLERQTALFSATFPESIERMSRAHQRSPVRIIIDDSQEAPPAIRQLLLRAEPDKKPDALLWALESFTYETALIFCNFKATVTDLERRLHLVGASVGCLHGDLEQYDRDRVLALFRSESLRILIATDVAARGIDVTDLDLVINYELPSQPEIYVHRIGRTGRAGKPGLAVSLVSDLETPKLNILRQLSISDLEKLDWSTSSKTGSLKRPARMQTIQISGGRKDKVRPGDILGALTGDAGGLQGSDIGKIEIHERFSYVAVTLKHSVAAAKSLSNGHIKGKRFRSTIVQ